jgi:hypothetical protein
LNLIPFLENTQMGQALFRPIVTKYYLENVWIDAHGKPCPANTPNAKFHARRKVKANTPGAKKVTIKAKKWYARLSGSSKAIPLSKNKTAALQMLAELQRKAEFIKVGLVDPFEEHRKRPLSEHLVDWHQSILAGGATAKHARQTLRSVQRIVEGCSFASTHDIIASRVSNWLAQQRACSNDLPAPDANKQHWTRNELAKLLGVEPNAIPPAIRRHRLEATGNG